MGHGIERIVERGLDVDCFAYAGARPWHGLGQRVGERGDHSITLPSIERAARADWRVVTDGVKTCTRDNDIDGMQALVRDRDAKVLGFATSKYAVIQHGELGLLLDVLVEARRATWETVGCLHGGQRVFYAIRLDTKLEAVRGDETELFAIATTSHDGTATATLLLSAVRVVCANTLALAMSSNQAIVSVRHAGKPSDALARARDVVLGVDQRVGELREEMGVLTKLNLSQSQAQRFLDRLVPLPELPPAEAFAGFTEEKQKRALYEREFAARTQAKLVELHESHVGQDIARRGSGYAWLQATTAYATHVMRSRGKVESLMIGDAAKLGRRAFTLLTEQRSRGEILAA